MPWSRPGVYDFWKRATKESAGSPCRSSSSGTITSATKGRASTASAMARRAASVSAPVLSDLGEVLRCGEHAMVGREREHPVAGAHLRIEHIEELGEGTVQGVKVGELLLTQWSVLVSDVVGRGERHREEIGHP